jgi:Short repeat of unknown function (DUF308)
MTTSGGHEAPPDYSSLLARSWQTTLVLGALTLILGIIVSAHPTESLNVVAVLLGIVMIISGIFHLIRAFDADQLHRVWADPSPAPDPGAHRPVHRHHLDRPGPGRAPRRAGRRRPRGKGLVDRLRRGEPHRRDRGRGHARQLARCAGHAARDLVHHHGCLRDRRGIAAPPRPPPGPRQAGRRQNDNAGVTPALRTPPAGPGGVLSVKPRG